MKYNFKDLIIESEFDIFDVKFIEFYGDFFELYFEKDNKFYQFYVYEPESEDDKTIKVVFKKYSAYQNMINDYKSKLNFFEFIEYISHKNYNKKLFNKIKDKLRDNYVEFLI